MARLLAIGLGLALVFAGGCGSSEDTKSGDLLGQASQDITGGTWENPDDPGDALLFRSNGTGQIHEAARNTTAEIIWSVQLTSGRVLLSWSYLEAPAEGTQEWIVEIDGDAMEVWPQKGSQVILDPDTDEPFVLVRIEG